MSKALTKVDVIALAKLAKLNLRDEELEQFISELNAVLEYVAKLSEVDTAGLDPTHQVTGLHNVTRPDEVREQVSTPDELLALAPKHKDGYIQVGRMI